MGNHLTGSGLLRRQANRQRTHSEAHPVYGIESVETVHKK
jgi:hypothetical protein